MHDCSRKIMHCCRKLTFEVDVFANVYFDPKSGQKQLQGVPSAKWRWHRLYWGQRHFAEGTPASEAGRL